MITLEKTCTRHARTIANLPLEVLAEQIGDLHYESLQELLRHLQNKLARDAVADDGRNRPRLAGALRESAAAVGQAERAISRAWKISKPYM